jgi:hypothetical protein
MGNFPFGNGRSTDCIAEMHESSFNVPGHVHVCLFDVLSYQKLVLLRFYKVILLVLLLIHNGGLCPFFYQD